jgi:shikimate dehydrogenase
MHREALRLAGLEGEYNVISAGLADLAGVAGQLMSGVMDGLNVTMPLKEAARRLAGRLTPEAMMAGAVNSLRVRVGVLEAHSTDVTAFQAIFRRHPGADSLLVLGGGGAARSALAAWTGPLASVSVRSASKIGGLLDHWPDLRVLDWGKSLDGAIVINATPIGMSGESLPEGIVQAAVVFVDLPYGRHPTPAIARATCPVVDGIDFLALQAADCFEWFTGVPVDSAALAMAARNV